MAKLNWLNRAIKTQHQRYQNDYAGRMGVKHRKFQAELAAEEQRIRDEALSDEERIEKQIRAEMLLNSWPADPNWVGAPIDLLDQVHKL